MKSNKSCANYGPGNHSSDQFSEGSDELNYEQSREDDLLINSKLSMALQFLQRANKLDISSPYKPESHTKPHSSDEDIVEDLLDDLQDVSDSLSHKIDGAIDKNLISDSSNALLKDISSGIVSLVSAVVELHKENDAKDLELHRNKTTSR